MKADLSSSMCVRRVVAGRCERCRRVLKVKMCWDVLMEVVKERLFARRRNVWELDRSVDGKWLMKGGYWRRFFVVSRFRRRRY